MVFLTFFANIQTGTLTATGQPETKTHRKWARGKQGRANRNVCMCVCYIVRTHLNRNIQITALSHLCQSPLHPLGNRSSRHLPRNVLMVFLSLPKSHFTEFLRIGLVGFVSVSKWKINTHTHTPSTLWWCRRVAFGGFRLKCGDEISCFFLGWAF